MHKDILKLVFIHIDLLYVSTNHMVVIREVKYELIVYSIDVILTVHHR